MNKLKLRARQFNIILRFLFFKLISFTYKNKYKNLWLISERGDEARDNGYAFFQYLSENHKNLNFKYVISKKSVDIAKIKDKSRIVFYQSNEHIKMYISAKYLISSHIMGASPEFRCFGKLDKKIRLFKVSGKKIFLQHGITKDYIEYLTNKCVDLDLFICGAHPEYEYIKQNFGFNDSVVQYTGFARFDNLKSESSNIILFMPTWRKELFYCSNDIEFMKTEYYIRINQIINDPVINSELEKNNLKLVFYPHYEIQKYIKSFKTTNKNVIIASKSEYDVPELLRKCNMLITDYSSVYFDIAYQNKPVIYYQYDYESYRKNQYSEGYFNYKKDGFGFVVDNKKELIEKICDYIKSDFIVENKFLERINRFFVYNDVNNCDRIFKKINQL